MTSPTAAAMSGPTNAPVNGSEPDVDAAEANSDAATVTLKSSERGLPSGFVPTSAIVHVPDGVDAGNTTSPSTVPSSAVAVKVPMVAFVDPHVCSTATDEDGSNPFPCTCSVCPDVGVVVESEST